MTGKCKRLHERKCDFCDRFWRLVITYGLPLAALAFGGCGGAVVAFYLAGGL